MKHLIVNATPKRKSLLVYENPNINTRLSKRLKGNRVGRLEKVTEKIKKQLIFSEDCNKLWSKKKNFATVKETFSGQKAGIFKKPWKDNVDSFLSKHSRVMPYKNDTKKYNDKWKPCSETSSATFKERTL